MKDLIIPEGYASVLSLRETERAIKAVKDIFERSLAERLNLERITAPLFVEKASGLNDDLNGRPLRNRSVPRKVEAHGALPLRLSSRRGALYGYERHPSGRRYG